MKRIAFRQRPWPRSALVESIEPRTMLAVLVGVETGGSTGRQVSVTPSVASGVTSSVFNRGSDTNYLPASGASTQLHGIYGYPRQGDNRYGLNQAEGVTRGHYFQFTVTPGTGKQLALTQLDFAPYVEDGTKGANIAVEYQVGSGSTVTAYTGTTYTTGGPVAFKSASLSLSNITQPVTFRIIFWSIGQTGFGSGASNILTYSTTSIGLHSGSDVELQGTVSDATPATPTALAAAPVISGLANKLTWTDNATNETAYALDKSLSSTFASGVTTIPLSANTVTYTDTAVDAGDKFYYRVRAVNGSTPSANSTTTSTRAIHIYEQWDQFSGTTPQRDPQYDFDTSNIIGSYGNAFPPYGAFERLNPNTPNDYTPDYTTLSTTNIAAAANATPNGGLLIDDIEEEGGYTFYVEDLSTISDMTARHAAIDARIDPAIELHQEFASIARNAHSNIKIGIFYTPPRFSHYDSTQIDDWEYVMDRVKSELIVPGTYFDFSAMGIYAWDDSNFSSHMATNESVVDYFQAGPNASSVIPFFRSTGVNSDQVFNTTQLNAVADLIAECGYEAIRWEGPSIPSSTAMETAQTTIVDRLRLS